MTRRAKRRRNRRPATGLADVVRFVHVDAGRWQRGQRPAGASATVWRALGWPLVALAIGLAGTAWALLPTGRAHTVGALWPALPVGVVLAWCLAIALWAAWRWARWASVLELTRTSLARRYRWRWMRALAGWQAPLGRVHAQLTLTPVVLGADPLRQVRLSVVPGVRSKSLVVADWAPADGQAHPGPWPSAQVLPSLAERLRRAVARAHRPALRADLQRRLPQLPLAQALAARGVALHLPLKPAPFSAV